MKNIIKSREFSSLLAIFIIFGIVGLFNPSFLEKENIFQTINGSVVYGFVALGMAFVLFIGEIDVSVGATLGFAAAIAGNMVVGGSSLIAVLIAVTLFGIIVGLTNAVGVLYFKIPSIIMTLGINGIIRGSIYVYTGGKWIENLPIGFKSLSQKSLFNTFSIFYIALFLITLLLFLIMKKTDFGKSFLAVGDNQEGARLIGININRTKALSFILCSVFASIAGVFYASRVGFITPTAGVAYEMTAIAACVIGGISLSGGVGSVFGAMIGSVIMVSISRILVFLKLPSTFDNTITGLILIVIVVSSAVLSKKSTEKIRKARFKARIEN